MRRGDFPGNIFFAALAALLVMLSAPATAKAAAPAQQNVLRATLANGLQVIVVRDPLAPVVTTEINYRVGSNEAPAGFPGTAHAVEHMMFRGSPGLTGPQLAAIGAGMGGNFDADTQQSLTQYFYTAPADDLDLALSIEALRMRGLSGGASGWAKERGAIEQEVAADLSNPGYVLSVKLLAQMFQGTPYAHDALGTRPSFDQTTWAMLKNFHDTWYVPNNAVLIIAGDVDPQAALALVQARFGDIPARRLPERPPVKLAPVRPEALAMTTDRPYGMAVLAFRLPGFDSPDYAAADLLGDVLNSQRGQLYALVPQGKALFTGFMYNPLPKSGLAYAAAGFPKGADGAALLKQLRAVLADIAAHGVPPDLLEAAKRHEVADLELQKNSTSDLADLWSTAVALEGRQSPQDDIAAYRNVTPADVQRVAREYLDQAHAISAILTPQPSGKPIASSGFGGKESFGAGPAHAVKLPAWAKKQVMQLNIPRSTLNPVVTVFPNGLKLIVQRETISKTVSVYGHIRNEPLLEAPKGEEGVSEVLGQMFSYGTTSLDRLAFQKALDDISANEAAGADFALQVPAAQFDRGMALLADNELHPALPAQAFEIVRGETAAAVEGRLQSPDYLAGRSLITALAPKGDPTDREATGKTVSALTLDEVKAYYSKVFRPDLAVIVVIGDVDPGAARSVVGRYFGVWQAAGPKPQTVLPAVPDNRAATFAVPDASRVQDRVTLAETVDVRRTDPDYYPLMLGNRALGGGFYATRLYRDLRGNAGLVYYVSSSYSFDHTRTTYMVNYACDPPNVSRVRAMVARELREMQRERVSPAELHQAKGLVLREIALGEGSVDAIAQGLIYRTTHDLPLDEPTRAAHKFVRVSAEEVRRAYARWLRPEGVVEVSQGPAPR
ncbi:MAG TPA: pitrilysin family protein [Gallionellaceae bacterium]|nr:pitrilysin family protein [Gallionellaceae bacterium]